MEMNETVMVGEGLLTKMEMATRGLRGYEYFHYFYCRSGPIEVCKAPRDQIGSAASRGLR